MSDLLDVMAVRATGDPAAAVLRDLAPRAVEEVACDVLVVGGGTGGVAAALALARAGRTVCLTEETDWSDLPSCCVQVSSSPRCSLRERAGVSLLRGGWCGEPCTRWT